MKNFVKFLSLTLALSFVFLLVGCKDDTSIYDSSSDITDSADNSLPENVISGMPNQSVTVDKDGNVKEDTITVDELLGLGDSEKGNPNNASSNDDTSSNNSSNDTTSNDTPSNDDTPNDDSSNNDSSDDSNIDGEKDNNNQGYSSGWIH